VLHPADRNELVPKRELREIPWGKEETHHSSSRLIAEQKGNGSGLGQERKKTPTSVKL